jgi:hypothetical protein
MDTTYNLPGFREMTPETNARRWGSLPMLPPITGDPASVRSKIPVFRRAAAKEFGLRSNQNFDLIVKNPASDLLEDPTPVGLVSKTYSLIQHVDIFDAGLDFVQRVSQEDVQSVNVSMSENSERFFMSVHFGDKYSQYPDGQKITLRLICRNAVDGASAVRANLGWFRLVCSNGLYVGLKLGSVRMPHKEGADLATVFDSLDYQVQEAELDRKHMGQLQTEVIELPRIRSWADTTVAQSWGALAATRLWHICESGQDVSFAPPFAKIPPSQKRVKFLSNVPGCPAGANNFYAVAQALSWISSHRNDSVEADSMTREIPKLLAALRN